MAGHPHSNQQLSDKSEETNSLLGSFLENKKLYETGRSNTTQTSGFNGFPIKSASPKIEQSKDKQKLAIPKRHQKVI